jgi:molybdenum cofactor synthesis domain-containing protein
LVITVSDRTAAGQRADTSGPIALAALEAAGFACRSIVIPDGEQSVAQALRAAVKAGDRLIVTSGGTGVGPRDRTPEGTALVLDRQLPGIVEELRRRGAHETPGALLSRGISGTAGRALIVNLPGSPAAVASGMPVVIAVAAHVLDQLDGGDH